MVNSVNSSRDVEQYHGCKVHLLTRISNLHLLWREELSPPNDLFYMQTGMGFLSHGHMARYVLTVAYQQHVQPVLI